MASGFTIKVDGLTELGEKLAQLATLDANRIARSATGTAASLVKGAAQQRVPVDTGNLKANIIAKRVPAGESDLTSEHIVTIRTGGLTKKQKGAGLTGAFYGVFVEYGTVKMGPRPFLRPALDQNVQQAIDAMRDKLDAHRGAGELEDVSVPAEVFAALRSLVSDAVYRDTFLEGAGVPPAPAIRYTLIGGVVDPTICGSDDLGSPLVQVDVVHNTAKDRDALVAQVKAAMQSTTTPCVLQGLEISRFDVETKKYLSSLDYVFYPSSA